ncbi:MAG: tripartite tricarboxylate transporter substrate-binding protein [Burkholderiales bacterium]|nr:tripartite tricarboxylate transporter substrate-binding protein [Burkholderiales bacterium]
MTDPHPATRGRRAVLRGLAAASLAQAVPNAALAQSAWPAGPVRFIVPFPAGSGTDLNARLVGERLSAALGVPVVVDNRPGADGSIAAEAAARSKPDGQTVFVTSNSTHASNLALRRKLPYDPVKDFAPVTLLGTAPLLVLVHPSLPIRTIPEFNMTNVSYKGNPQAIADLAAGQVQAMFCDAGTALPQVQGARVRALAVTSLARSPSVPDLPTVAESGLPGYEMVAWFAVFLPAGTPEPIVTALNQKIVDIVRSPEFRAKTGPGADWAPGTPQQLAAFVDAEIAKWKRVVAQAKIEVE